MIITKGLGASRLITKGYGPASPALLSDIDPQHKGISTRSVVSVTRDRTSKLLKKRTVSRKWQ